MKNLVVSFVLFLVSFVGFSQVIKINSSEVNELVVYDFEMDTNGFGYMIEAGLVYDVSEVSNFVDLIIDLNKKTFTRTTNFYYNEITETFKIDSLEMLGDTINFSFLNYDKIKKVNYVSFVSFTTDNEGDYPIFINYYFVGRDIFGYMVLGDKTEIHLN